MSYELNLEEIDADGAVIGLVVRGDSKGIALDGPRDTPFSARKILAAVEKTGFVKR